MFKSNMVILYSSVCIMTFIWGCGTSDDGSETTRRKTLSIEDLKNDTELTSETVTEQLDEVASSIAEDHKDSLKLLDNGKQVIIEKTRACSATDGKVNVNINRAVSWSKEREGKFGTVSRTVSKSEVLNRLWSKEGEELTCDPLTNRVVLDRTKLDGVTFSVDFERNKEIKTTKPRKNKTVQTTISHSAKGNRSVIFISSQIDESANQMTIEKTITKSVTRNFKIDSAEKSFETTTTIATKEGSPLALTVVLDGATKDWTTKTIKSGVIVGTLASGGRIELSFNNVIFTKDGECKATSGVINGSIFEKDGTEAVKTLTIDFSNAPDSIDFGDGNIEEYIPDGCDLQK